MSNTVDNRVVEMKFKNEDFERGIKQTISSLDGLKKALEINTNSVDFSNIQREANKLNIDNITKSVELLSDRFSAMGVVGMSVLNNLTNKAIGLVERIGQISIGQILTGGKGRAQKVADARFQLEGLLKDADKVQSAFDSASKAVDGTAYGLDAAVSTASQLTASNVALGNDLDTALRGVAGLAAMTNTSFEEMGNIFATVASNGRLMGMQLTQISSRGINVAAELAKQLGKSEEQIRKMVSKGQISFKEFASAMNNAFGDQAQRANETLSGSLNNVRAALSRIGEIFYSGIIENKDFIKFINDIRVAINGVKKALEPLKTPFANLVSSMSKFGSAIISVIQTDKFENFVYRIANMFDMLGNVIDGYTKKINDFKKTLGLDEVEEATEKAREISKNEIKAAEDILYRGMYGTGAARKKMIEDAGMDYKNVQDYVNALIAANYDAAKANEIYAKSVKETAKETQNSTESINSYSDYLNKIKHSSEQSESNLSKLKKSLQNTINGFVKIIKAIGLAFNKVFNKKNTKIIDGLVDGIYRFTETFKITEDEADKIERTFAGVFSIVDLLKKAIEVAARIITGVINPAANSVGDAILGLTAKIGDLIFKFNEFISTNKTIKKIFSFIETTFTKAMFYIREFIKAFSDNKDFNNFLKTVKEIASSIVDTLFPSLKDAKDEVNGVADALKDEDISWIKSTVDKISGFLSSVAGIISKYKDEIVGTISFITEKIKKLFSIFDKKEQKNVKKASASVSKSAKEVEQQVGLIGLAMEYLKKIFEKIKPLAKDLFDDFIEDLKNLTPGQIAILSIAGALTIFLISLTAIAGAAKKFIRSFGRIGESISNTIDEFRKRLHDLKKDKNRAYLLTLLKEVIVLVGLVSLSLYKLSSIDPKRLILTAGVLVGVVAAIIALTKAVANYGKTIKDWQTQMIIAEHIKNAESLIKTLAKSLVLLSVSLKIVDSIDSEHIWEKLAAFTILLIEAVGIAWVLSKHIKDIEKSSDALVKISKAILTMSISLLLLAKADSNGSTIIAALAIAIVLGTLCFALYKLSDSTEKIDVKPIVKFVKAVKSIASTLIALAIVSRYFGGIIKAAVTLSIMMYSLVKAAESLAELAEKTGDLDKDAIKNVQMLVLILTGSLLSMANAVSIIAKIKSYGKIAVAVSSLLVSIYVLTEMAKKLSEMPEDAGNKTKTLLILTIALLAISSAITKIAKKGKDWQTIAVSALSLIAVIGVMFLIVKAFSDMDDTDTKGVVSKAAAILVLTLALSPIANAIKKLAGYNWGELIPATVSIILVLGALAVIIGILSKISSTPTGMAAILIVAAALSAVALALAYATKIFVASIGSLIKSIKELTKINYKKIDITTLTKLMGLLLKFSFIAGIASVGISSLGISVILLGAGLTLIAVAISTILKSFTLLVNAITNFIEVIKTLPKSSTGVSKSMKRFGEDVTKFIATFGSALVNGIKVFLKGLESNAKTIGTLLKNVIVTIVKVIMEAKKDIAEVIIDGFIELFDMLAEKLPKLTEKLDFVGEFLKKIAEYSVEWGYYGMIIIINFVDGMIYGLAMKSEELIDAVVYLSLKTIKAISDTFEKYKDVIAQGVEKSYSSHSAKVWQWYADYAHDTPIGDFAQEQADFLKQNANTVNNQLDAELAALDAEHSKKRAENHENSMVDAYNKVSYDKLADGPAKQEYQKAMNKAGEANKQTNAEVAKDVSNNQITSFTEAIQSGDWQGAYEAVKNSMGAASSGGTKAAIEYETKTITKSVEGLSDTAIEAMKKDGWKMNDAGTEMVKEYTEAVKNQVNETDSKDLLGDLGNLLGVDGTNPDSIGGQFTALFDKLGLNASESGEQIISGLLGPLTSEESLTKIGDAAGGLGDEIKEKFNLSMKIESPSKEAIKSANYWIDGLLIPLSTRTGELGEAAINNAHSILDGFDSEISNSDTAFTPTIRPVLDTNNMGQYSGFMDILNNPATVQLAADSQLSINNTSQMRLAQQIEGLRQDINKMANQDLSKIMDGVNINVNANTTVDGHQLRKTSAQYTIGQINKQEMGYAMATGGRL